MVKHLLAAAALFFVGQACTYNPPPSVTLVGPANFHFLTGESITLKFSEQVDPDSVEIIVWPGHKDLYDIEGSLLPGNKAILEPCRPSTSPCGPDGGVKVLVSVDQMEAEIRVEGEALGKLGQPLVLEVTGNLADLDGNRSGASRKFDFQIVGEVWDPFADVVEEEDIVEEVNVEPLGIIDGRFLMHADFTSPIKISQQYFLDIKVNQVTGKFVLLLVDADAKDGVPPNTSDPYELELDEGPESFIFVMPGSIEKDEEGIVRFESEPVVLMQTIGPIYFEMRQMVSAGTIDQSGPRARWDGTIAVKEIYYEVGGQGTTYPADQANFEVFQLLDEEVPEGIPIVCEEDPCWATNGNCYLPEIWPPPEVCE
jgi:hypothetical protein